VFVSPPRLPTPPLFFLPDDTLPEMDSNSLSVLPNDPHTVLFPLLRLFPVFGANLPCSHEMPPLSPCSARVRRPSNPDSLQAPHPQPFLFDFSRSPDPACRSPPPISVRLWTFLFPGLFCFYPQALPLPPSYTAPKSPLIPIFRQPQFFFCFSVLTIPRGARIRVLTAGVRFPEFL